MKKGAPVLYFLYRLFLNVNSKKLIILAGPHSPIKSVLSYWLSFSFFFSLFSPNSNTPSNFLSLPLCAIPVPIPMTSSFIFVHSHPSLTSPLLQLSFFYLNTNHLYPLLLILHHYYCYHYIQSFFSYPFYYFTYTFYTMLIQ